MMHTPWTELVDKKCPLPEYPRPQMVRDTWQNLNGTWDYAILRAYTTSSDPLSVDDPTTVPLSWQGTIVVPFAPETELSTVNRSVLPHQILWYRRTFAVRKSPNKRILLHFGAVDHSCRVAVNGVEVGSHHGGYLPFSFDITDAVVPGNNEIVVAVRDVTDSRWITHGKQSLQPGGIWYTPQTGIWQTVWIEEVPQSFIESIDITPQPGLEEMEVMIRTVTAGVGRASEAPSDATVTIGDHQFSVPVDTPMVVSVPGLPLWSPDDPNLVPVKVTWGDDSVDSYCAMRTFEARDGQFLLNGKPIMALGVLDQGYWPDGGYTAPTDEALIFDIATAKEMGFNTLRKHAKVEPRRWYYHCDQLGMMVWQDMPNGGRIPHKALLHGRVALAFWLPDKPGALLGRQDPASVVLFEQELTDMIDTLRSSPSVVLWVPFNEGWGQFDAARIAAKTKKLDPSRVVDHASGWFDQDAGDLRSVHLYFRPPRLVGRGFAKSDPRVLSLTEYGGFTYPVEGHVWADTTFGYATYHSREEFQKAFIDLHAKELPPVVERGLRGIIYTQLTDVEEEANGLISYDRQVVKLDPNLVRKVLRVVERAQHV